MSRMFGLLSTTKLATHGSSTSLSELDQVASLKEALEGLDALLNDDLSGAEKILANGSSAFHKTGHSAVSFMRAVIGFEADMLKEATERIADAEATAERQKKLAMKETHSQGRYDPGAEYMLCTALCLLMSAVTSFLSESVVESLRGAYKLRKSYQLLHKLFDMIVAVDGHPPNHTDTTNTTTKVVATPEEMSETSEDSDDDFVDATDDIADLANPNTLPKSMSDMALSNGTSRSEPIPKLDITADDFIDGRPSSANSTPVSHSPPIDRRASLTTVSSFHDIPTPPEKETTLTDETIYAGTLMALGSIMLLISLLPPSLSRLLSIIGFRGSRSLALSMLWKVSSQPSPFGGLATFFLGTYYGNIVQNSDIIGDEFHATRNGNSTLEKLHRNLVQIRRRYPASALWIVEEARMESMKGNLEEVVRRLQDIQVNSEMPQIQSFVTFEGALHNLMTHRYEDAAHSFIRMCATNKWSHGLYTYIAGICYAELFRQNPSNSAYGSKANSLLDSVPSLLSKRKSFGGKRIPFEQFVDRKITRFQSRAPNGSIVEGITGPVTEEVTYLLCNGQKRMGAKDLEKSWESLELWSEVEGGEEEEVATAFLKSVVDRNAGRYKDARDRIEEKVIGEALSKRTQLGCNDWVAGYAYYEMAVISWKQQRPVDEIRGWLKRATDQGDFTLSNRLSLRIQVAQETLKRK